MTITSQLGLLITGPVESWFSLLAAVLEAVDI